MLQLVDNARFPDGRSLLQSKVNPDFFEPNMLDGEHPDFEALLKTAALIRQDQLEQFTKLLPENTRQELLRRLGETVASDAPTKEEFADQSRFLPPTVIVEPKNDMAVVERTVDAQSSDNVRLVKLHAKGAVGEV